VWEVAKPRSRGRVWITSADPDDRPAIDYRYFTDPDGTDEAILIAAVRAGRRIGESEPMASHLRREVFPGPRATSDADISALARATHQTVYHVSGTCRMGAPDDPLAVLDPDLRVRDVPGLRVADASVFPTIPSVNPVVTVMLTAERAADLFRHDL
jgi:choline dehydrogenase-like flavoprotein